MRDHAKHCRVEAEGGQRGDPEHDKAHVRDGAEGDESLHVGLGEAAKRAIDDADDRETTDPWCPRLGGRRQDRNGNADEPVCAELQQNRGQDDRALGGRLCVRVGKPRVERKHRHLDGEADEHAREDPDLHRLAKQSTVSCQIRDAEAGLACWHLARHLEVQGEKGDEHERRTEHGVEEELERCVLAIFATPDTDHEVHRQQHEFEEDEEQDEVLRDEGTGHANLQHQHENQKRLRITRRRDVIPRIDHHQHGDDHAQDVQRQAQTIEANREVAMDDFDPRRVGEELQLAGAAIAELRQRVHPNYQCGKRGEQRDLLVQQFLPLGDEHHDEYTNERQEGADRE